MSTHEEKMKRYLGRGLSDPIWVSGEKEFWSSYGADIEARQAFFDLVEQEKPRSVLDVGCGKGRDGKPILKLGVDYVGVDPFEVNIKWAQNRYPGVDFRLGFMQELPFEDNSFDWIWLNGVISYLPENQLNQGIQECIRVARKRIYICSTSRKSSTFTDRYNAIPRNLPLKIWRVSYYKLRGREFLMWEIKLDEEIGCGHNTR